MLAAPGDQTRHHDGSTRISFLFRYRSGDGAGQLFQALEVVAGEKDIYMGKCCSHAPRERLVAGGGLQGVDPDDFVREAFQAHHLLGKHLDIPPVPAVGEYYDYRAAGHATLSPSVYELFNGVPEPGSS